MAATSLPLLILEGRHLPIAVVAAAIAQGPPPLPPHRALILVPEDCPEDCDSPKLSIVRTNARAIAPALAAPTAWVGYGLLSEQGDWPFAALPWPGPDLLQDHDLAPWLPPPPPFPPETAQASPQAATTWLAAPGLLRVALAEQSAGLASVPWSLLDVAEGLERRRMPYRWRVWAGAMEPIPGSWGGPPQGRPKPSPAVLAIVPHYRCEAWLGRCLASLVHQTRPPDRIVVVDDGSPVPPTAIVAAFPTVTLLSAPATVGPYRLVQQVIDGTAYEYYLFQDADDWAPGDRVATLLAAAEWTQADLIGSQELRLERDRGLLFPIHYPLDVNLALAAKPGHPLLHPTSLVRRRLVEAVGGFATGLRFGGDTEFLLRAALRGRIINLPTYGYFRQKRPHSLTTDAHTGLGSPARQALLQQLKRRADQNRAALRRDRPPDLTPLCQAPPIPLQHHCGPPLMPCAPSM